MGEINIRIYINNEPTDTQYDTISQILKDRPTPEKPFLIVRKTKKAHAIENRYEIVTSKGSFVIETFNNEIQKYFDKNMDKFKNIQLQWEDKKTINFGYFQTPFEVTRKQYDYERYSVLIGYSGFDKTLGVLIFTKKGYIGRNGIENSKFGRVIKGKHVLDELKSNDMIMEIKKIIVTSELYDYKVITQDKEKISENDNIITKLKISLKEKCPYSCEHFLFLTKDFEFTVDESLKTFCKNDYLRGVELPKECNGSRTKASISVRNKGKGKGSIFIYFTDIVEDKSHNVFAEIVNGIELVRNLKEGQKCNVEITNNRINTLGMTQLEAEDTAKKNGLEHEREGMREDDAIVILQTPELTMDAMKKGKITTKGIDPKKVFKIRLYEEAAPESVKYFKTITGLNTRQLGRLEVLFSHEELDMILFKGDQKLGGNLIPENPPVKGAKKGKIGITNMASRQKGTIGIRFNDSKDFGPTGEDSHHTNCMGEIEKHELLRSLKDGEIIYLTLIN